MFLMLFFVNKSILTGLQFRKKHVQHPEKSIFSVLAKISYNIVLFNFNLIAPTKMNMKNKQGENINNE